MLFDFDGVIRHWRTEPVTVLERRHDLPPGAILEAAHRVPEYELGVLGHVSFDEWCDATARALEPAAGRWTGEVVAAWSRYRGDLDPVMVELVGALARRPHVGLLSNAHDCLRADLRAHRIDRLFEHVICSAEAHLAKPDPRIYTLAAHTFGVEPASCAFIDDRPENVLAARRAGMRAHLFTDPTSCAAFITQERNAATAPPTPAPE
ncbi:HAD family hydrolase [Cellulomonas cellasea]|uniref:Putative hydrolase of the HAD superfamily n=1 Tax=Cellulomonas cellasea TaxID=43670 RepID=A0A7W4UJX4_9CELL|nr:HAD-IA family hydrolase [Cellulomonas cellasea]MBB2925531.1 putative hydrolase of the HAD superfamily [Cellulomonas cellasea]